MVGVRIMAHQHCDMSVLQGRGGVWKQPSFMVGDSCCWLKSWGIVQGILAANPKAQPMIIVRKQLPPSHGTPHVAQILNMRKIFKWRIKAEQEFGVQFCDVTCSAEFHCVSLKCFIFLLPWLGLYLEKLHVWFWEHIFNDNHILSNIFIGISQHQSV